MLIPSSRHLTLGGLALLSLTLAFIAVPDLGHAEPGDGEQAEKISLPVVSGPAQGDLGGIATVQIPAGYEFVEQKNMPILNAMTGNLNNPKDVGAILGPDNWVVFFSWDPVGYVKDDDKDELDADELLSTFQEADEPSNEARQAQGLGTLHTEGWETPPFYDEKTNNLTWALRLRSGSGGRNVNREVRLLGRRGAMSVILAAGPEHMNTAVPALNTLIEGVKFTTGNSYAEYVEGDKVAAYGLTGLVLGGGLLAAAKGGLLGKLGKFAKFIIIGGIAVVGGIANWFKSKFNGK